MFFYCLDFAGFMLGFPGFLFGFRRFREFWVGNPKKNGFCFDFTTQFGLKQNFWVRFLHFLAILLVFALALTVFCHLNFFQIFFWISDFRLKMSIKF
jgi:hypothetical protein